MVSLTVMAMLSTMPATNVTYTKEEVVAACIIAEAGGEGTIGMYAVMAVIKNRSRGSVSPTSWYNVVTKKKQFSCFNNGINSVVAKAKTHDNWKTALNFVEAAKGNMVDPTKGATHYHVCTGPSKVSPYWTHPNFGGKNKKCIVTAVIGRHVFLSNVD